MTMLHDVSRMHHNYIAATPKGVASYLYPALFSRGIASFAAPPCFRGESLHSLSLIRSSPRYVPGTPKGVLSNDQTSELLKSSVFSYDCTSELPNLRLPFAEPPSSFRRTSVFLSPNLRLPFADIPKVAFHHPMRLLIMSQPGIPYYIIYTPFVNQRLLIVYKPFIVLPSCHIFTLINSMLC